MAGAARLVGGVLVALLLAGCGGGAGRHAISASGSMALHRLLRRGAAAEARVGSGRMLLTETFVDPSHTAYLRETIDWRHSPRELRAVAVSDLSGRTLTSVVLAVGGYDYLGGPAYAAHLPQGKRWLRAPRSRVAAAVGVPLSTSRLIGDLSAASAVKRVGTSTVDGMKATQFRYLLDFSRLTAKARAQSLFGRMASVLGNVRIPTRLWVAADGLPLMERGWIHHRGATVRIDVSLTYGEPVHVAAPPAALVVDAPADASKSTV